MQEKLELFAKLSGDYNPVHLDAEFARETYFGTQIVYGIFQVFCTLESALQTIQTNPKFQNFQAPLFLAQIKATFHAPIRKDSAHKMKCKGSFSQIVCGGGGKTRLCAKPFYFGVFKRVGFCNILGWRSVPQSFQGKGGMHEQY